MTGDHSYRLRDVLARGFEAFCVGPDGCRYLWPGDAGLKVELQTGRATLVRDAAALPQEMWSPTRWGLEELAADESPESAPSDAGGRGGRAPPGRG